MQFHISMSPDQVVAFVKLLNRITTQDVMRVATSDQEAHTMWEALNKAQQDSIFAHAEIQNVNMPLESRVLTATK